MSVLSAAITQRQVLASEQGSGGVPYWARYTGGVSPFAVAALAEGVRALTRDPARAAGFARVLKALLRAAR